MRRWILLLVGALLMVAGCAVSQDASQELDVKVNTESDLAWRQHQANLAFANAYEPACPTAKDQRWSGRPRALITGFGRFLSNRTNATGMMVAQILEDFEYPLVDSPAIDEVDLPAPQTRAARGVITLPRVGEIDVCVMVLPVFWDLSAALVLKEIDAFRPDFVLMNGIAGSRQPLWLELGAVNRAKVLSDGSRHLSPVEAGAPLVPTASEDELARPQLLSWLSVRQAVDDAIADRADVMRDSTPLSSVVQGTKLAGFPRRSNTYLCNNVTYTVGYLMDHPDETVRLMEASDVRESGEGFLDMALKDDHSFTPRLFVHWPSDMSGEHLVAGSEVMLALVDAQLHALFGEDGEVPFWGDNDMAEIAGDSGGDTF